MARKPGPVQQPSNTPSPPPPKLKPKQEKYDPIPQQKPLFSSKNAPVTRSQLHKPSTMAATAAAATIEPVDPLKLLKPKMMSSSTPAKSKDRLVLKKLSTKKVKRKRSPERDSVSKIKSIKY